jgi:hypothetical protein
MKRKLLNGTAMDVVLAFKQAASHPPAIRLADGVRVPGWMNPQPIELA